MDVLLFLVNIAIRARHRRLYASGCIVLLLLVIGILWVVMLSPHIESATSHAYESYLVNRQEDDEKSTTECEDIETEVTQTTLPFLYEPTEKHSQSTIFAITPTRKRLTQLLDLTSLCQTLMNVDNLIWIVVESSYVKTSLVTDLLSRCTIKSVHLSLRATRGIDSSKNHKQLSTNRVRVSSKRKIAERNVGLDWIRDFCKNDENCTGVVYFMEDENKYDLRLFEQIRQVTYVGLWPVAYAGRLKFEGPVCVNGSIIEWHVLRNTRPFPIDVAGFAVNVQAVLHSPDAKYGYAPHSSVRAKAGWEESDFLRNFIKDQSDPRIECRGSNEEAYVWHVQSEIDPYLREHSYKWNYKLRT